MFKKVNSYERLDSFNEIWKQCWIEKGYELELSDITLERFLVGTEGQYKGTFEFKQLAFSQIDEVFPFSSFDHIKKNFEHVVEIDKLSILPQYRGKHILNMILSFITYYAEENDVRQYIALLEPKLYLAFLRYYKLPVTKLGEKFHYKGDDVIPVSIDTSLVYNFKGDYHWLIDIEIEDAVLANITHIPNGVYNRGKSE